MKSPIFLLKIRSHTSADTVAYLKVSTTAVTVPSMCGVSQEVKISRANARLDLELKALICGDPYSHTREMLLQLEHESTELGTRWNLFGEQASGERLAYVSSVELRC